MTALLPLFLLVLLLLAPRRGGRPVGRGAKLAAAFLLAWGLVAFAFASVWNALLATR